MGEPHATSRRSAVVDPPSFFARLPPSSASSSGGSARLSGETRNRCGDSVHFSPASDTTETVFELSFLTIP